MIFFSIKIKIKERKFSSNNIMELFPGGNFLHGKISMWKYLHKEIFHEFCFWWHFHFFNLHIFSVHLMHADASSWKIFVCLAKIAKSNSQLIIYTHRYFPQWDKKWKKYCNKVKSKTTSNARNQCFFR